MTDTIGLVFDLNKNWIGGSYYIRNLVSALAMLPEAEQPNLILICERADSVRFLMETGYPKLGWLRAEEFRANPDRYPFDALFPWTPPGQAYRTISWIPDFQELHLPHYFSPADIAERRGNHRKSFEAAGLIVSSETVRQDVETFYPGECAQVAVVRFATFDRFDSSRAAEVRKTYGLNGRFVMCANQVWVHKNHIAVMKAVALLKARGVAVTVVFTGNESDYRIAGYSSFLRNLVKEWGLTEQIRFLGFIPRDDQLNLMSLADYVIQPSLFEGWSTVIEDAKAMNQFVVASDIDVHKEQLTRNSRFFSRHNPEALAAIMEEFAQVPPVPETGCDYDEARRSFARDFIATVDRFRPRKRRSSTLTKPISPAELAQIAAQNMLTASHDSPARGAGAKGLRARLIRLLPGPLRRGLRRLLRRG